MATGTPLNLGLFRLHRIFYVAMAAIAVIVFVIGLPEMKSGDPAAGFIALFFLPLCLMHYFAARGAREGKTYGLVLSRIIGTLWLVGFPIGTALGVWTWVQTGENWKGSVDQIESPQRPSSAPNGGA